MASELVWDRLSEALSPYASVSPPPQPRPRAARPLLDTDLVEVPSPGPWAVDALGLSIVEASHDCIEVIDRAGNLQFANPVALRQLRGIDTDENEGEPWCLSWPAEVRPAVLAAIAEASLNGTARFAHWRPIASGERRYWDVALSRMLDGAGKPLGCLAVSRDITLLARTETGHDLRSRELSHRLKNLFALVNGLVTLSARAVPEVKPYAHSLRERFTSLGRALEYLHLPPQDGSAPTGHTLQGLLRTLLAPYDATGSSSPRFRFYKGADVPIGDAAVTSLALIIHELATNAIKHGALSGEAGTVSVSCRRYRDSIRLTWREHGGPPVTQPPERSGFGSTLVERSVTGQLGGTIRHRWETEGLRVIITLPTHLLTDRTAA